MRPDVFRPRLEVDRDRLRLEVERDRVLDERRRVEALREPPEDRRLDVERLEDERRRDVDRDRDGTLPPLRRASFSPMAIACDRLRTFRPDPLRSVPRFLRLIVDSTFSDALCPYLAIETLRGGIAKRVLMSVRMEPARSRAFARVIAHDITLDRARNGDGMLIVGRALPTRLRAPLDGTARYGAASSLSATRPAGPRSGRPLPRGLPE